MSTPPSLDRFLPEFIPHRESRDIEDAEAASGARAYLGSVREFLAARQAAGGSGQAVNEANSDAFDRLLRRLYGLAESQHYADGGEVGARVSIAAVGGYARREMSLASDVDLLFLHSGEISPLAAHVAERIQYWLWDAGAEVSGAVRSIEETLSLCRSEPSCLHDHHRCALSGRRRRALPRVHRSNSQRPPGEARRFRERPGRGPDGAPSRNTAAPSTCCSRI